MTEELIDRARAVREGEELDAAKLEAFLADHVAGFTGPLTIEQFPKGHSNLTYLLRAGELELVLRRPPFGAKIKTAHDMGREFRILSALDGVYAKVPRPLAHCDDAAVIGAPFYVMERARGIILRKNRPEKGLDMSPEVMADLSRALIDNLAQLHAVDIERTGLSNLAIPKVMLSGRSRGGPNVTSTPRPTRFPRSKRRRSGWRKTCRPRAARRSSTTTISTTTSSWTPTS